LPDRAKQTAWLALAVLLAIAALGVVAVLVATSRYGPAMSTDSMIYIGGAQQLLAGKGYADAGGLANPTWPPMMSFVLVPIVWTGVDAVQAARVLNALVFAATIVVAGLWILRQTRSRALAVLVGALVAVSPLLAMARWLWSEPLFILLIVLYLWALTALCDRPSWRLLVVAAALAGAACLTRYIGFTLIPVGVCMLLLCPQLSLRKKIARCLAFGLVASLPLVAWLARNRALTGTLTGRRDPAKPGALSRAMIQIGGVLREWFAPFQAAARIPVITFVIVAAGLVLAIAPLVVLRPRPLRQQRRLSPMTAPLLFVAFYMAGLIASVANVFLYSITTRFLSPLYAPWVLLAAFAFADIAGRLRRAWPRASRRLLPAVAAILGGLLVAMLAVASVRVVQLVRHWAANGAGGYNEARWRESEIVAHLGRCPLDGVVFSNHPDVLGLLLGQKDATSSPVRRTLEARAAALKPFTDAIAADAPAYLVWFDPNWRDYLATPEELKPLCSLTPIGKFADGAIYRIGRAGPGTTRSTTSASRP